MPPAARTPPQAGLVTGTLFSFVVLGLSSGMLGVAWPVLRHDFNQPLASLGELLVASLFGYLSVSSITGWSLRRFGTVAVLLGSAVAACAGAGFFAFSRWWPVLVIAAMLLGAAGGGLDAALNTVVALDGRARLMNLLHAAYGVGGAIGPLLVTASLAATASWRGAYGALCVLEAVLAGVWVLLRSAFSQLTHRSATRDEPLWENRVTGLAGPRRPRVTISLSLAVFFIYTGLEVTTDSWAASYLRGPDGLPATLAGLAVFGYWAGLTAGRIGVAALGPRMAPHIAVRAGMAGGIGGGALVWAGLGPAASAAGLVVIGLSLGPIFPALVNLTPGRLGPGTAISAIGWQLAAAGAGGTGLSALAGVVFQLTGLGGFGPVLVLLAALLAGLNLLLEREASSGRLNVSGAR